MTVNTLIELENKDLKKDSENVVPLYTTLENEIEEFLFYHRRNSVATYNMYKSNVKRLAQTLFDRDHYKYITKEQIESLSVSDLVHYFDMCYLEENEEGERMYTNSTINHWISCTRSLIKHLAGRGYIDYDTNALSKFLKKLPDDSTSIDVLSDEDADRCLEYFKKFNMGEEMYRLANLSIDTGLRINELLTLEWGQFSTISENEVQITSRGKNKGKGNKSWSKIISTSEYEKLLELKKENSKRVFSIGRSTVAKYMNITVEKLGLNNDNKKYTFHSFRKNSVTFIYKTHGNDIRVAQEWANHGNINTTARYIKSNNVGMAGRKSLANKVDEQAYTKVSHEQLLDALSKWDESLLFNLNKQLSEYVEGDKVEEEII